MGGNASHSPLSWVLLVADCPETVDRLGYHDNADGCLHVDVLQLWHGCICCLCLSRDCQRASAIIHKAWCEKRDCAIILPLTCRQRSLFWLPRRLMGVRWGTGRSSEASCVY